MLTDVVPQAQIHQNQKSHLNRRWLSASQQHVMIWILADPPCSPVVWS